MTREVTIVPATEAHAQEIATRLRPGDMAEIEAAGLASCYALSQSVQLSLEAWTAFIDGEIAAMWGIVPELILGNVAQPWLMTTPVVERNRVRFMREARDFIEVKSRIWRVLHGEADGRYTKAIKLLQWLGFTVDAPENITWPFVRFSMTKGSR